MALSPLLRAQPPCKHAIWAVLLALWVGIICAPKPVDAGAWLDEVGQGFAAISGVAHADAPAELSFFGTYGLRPRLTLGSDLNTSDSYGHALLFLRHPLGPVDLPNKWAIELGAGGLRKDLRWSYMLRSTLSYGRGFSGRHTGWIAADLSIETSPLLPRAAYKLDGTLGLRRDQGPSVLFQLESYLDGQTKKIEYSLTPAILFTLPRTQNEVLMGLRYMGRRPEQLGLKLGLWHKF